MTEENDNLPAPIQQQLTELEARHKRHQAMLDEHHEAKFTRRDNHRRGYHKMKFPPGSLI